MLETVETKEVIASIKCLSKLFLTPKFFDKVVHIVANTSVGPIVCNSIDNRFHFMLYSIPTYWAVGILSRTHIPPPVCAL